MNKPSTSSGNKLVLGIRTDTAEASIALVSICHPEEEAQRSLSGSTDRIVRAVDRTDWTAGRQLSATLLSKIDELLVRNQLTWQALAGIVVYEGPGSFTGLRIGLTVANTAAFTLDIPIVGATGDDWLEQGARELKNDHFTDIITPHYGAEPNITKPKK